MQIIIAAPLAKTISKDLSFKDRKEINRMLSSISLSKIQSKGVKHLPHGVRILPIGNYRVVGIEKRKSFFVHKILRSKEIRALFETLSPQPILRSVTVIESKPQLLHKYAQKATKSKVGESSYQYLHKSAKVRKIATPRRLTRKSLTPKWRKGMNALFGETISKLVAHELIRYGVRGLVEVTKLFLS